MYVIPPEKIGAYLHEDQVYGVMPIFYLELSSGLRLGELLALLWTDIDIEKHTVSVTKTVNRMNGALKAQPPKTPKFICTVAIPAQAIAILVQEHEEHPDNPYLFPSPKTGTMYATPAPSAATTKSCCSGRALKKTCGSMTCAVPSPP